MKWCMSVSQSVSQSVSLSGSKSDGWVVRGACVNSVSLLGVVASSSPVAARSRGPPPPPGVIGDKRKWVVCIRICVQILGNGRKMALKSTRPKTPMIMNYYQSVGLHVCRSLCGNLWVSVCVYFRCCTGSVCGRRWVSSEARACSSSTGASCRLSSRRPSPSPSCSVSCYGQVDCAPFGFRSDVISAAAGRPARLLAVANRQTAQT